MGTRNVNLTDALDQFVEERIASGEFQNASEVVRAGLRLLKTEAEEHEQKLARLKAAIQVGIDEIERGEGIVVGVDELGAWFDSIEDEAARR